MFANIGWGEMLVLVIVGLVILGPERLPGAIRWTTNALRQARDYVSGATSNLRDQLGPEFDDLREPLAELQKLRGMSPRGADQDIYSTGMTRSSPASSTSRSICHRTRPRRSPRRSGRTPFDTDAT